MDIYELIHSDHEEARMILQQIDALSLLQHSSRFALFTKLQEIMIAHNEAEAGSFYIALEAHAATRKLAAESRKEHAEAVSLFADLSDAGIHPAKWLHRYMELQKALLNHIAEEEGEVFDAARQVISAPMAKELALIMDRLKQQRRELMRKAG